MKESPKETALRVKVQRMYEKADRIIEEAVSPEKLRNNPYKGKPLDLSRNPFEKERRLANRMLKSAGFAPFWVEMKKEIILEREEIRHLIDQFVGARQERLEKPENTAQQRESSEEFDEEVGEAESRFLQHVYERVAKLREKIDRYNLETPMVDQQLVNVRPEEWVEETKERLLRLK